MSSLLHARLATIEDASFQQLVDELHHCLGWHRDDDAIPTLFYLLSAITQEGASSLTLDHLPAPGLLSTPLHQLEEGNVADLCGELCRLMRLHPESVETRKLLSLLKDYITFLTPKPTRPPTAQQLDWEITRRRRRNRGS